MLTAIAVLLLSAVGGGVEGAYLTNSFPNDAICLECTEKEIYQEEVRYERLASKLRENENRDEESQQDPNQFLDEVENEHLNDFDDSYDEDKEGY